MKRFRFLGLVAVVVVAIVLAGCGIGPHYTTAPSGTPVPNQFQLVETYSWGTTLDVVAGDTQFGTVSSGAFSATFNYTDNGNKKLSSARPDFHLFAPSSDSIFDAQGHLAFTLKQDIDATFLSPYGNAMTVYDVYNAAGQKVAVSEKIDSFYTSTFTLTTPGGTPIAQLNRLAGGPYQSADIWQVQDFQTGDQILPKYVLIEIAAFKTAADDSARQQAQNNKSSTPSS